MTPQTTGGSLGWFGRALAGAAEALGTPAGVSPGVHARYCPTRHGVPDYSGEECRALPAQLGSAERR